MCRWLAYSGSPLPLERFVFKPEHSLIDQSMSATHTPKPTNGDGFGVGWYGRNGEPGRYLGVQPAWNDGNLRDISRHIESPLFLAHVRRSTGTAVQQSNCHPFRHGKWLFVHNGLIYGYQDIRRELLLEIDAGLVREIGGSTDSELMFQLALTYGLDSEPLPALERMVGFIEKVGRAAGTEHPIQMSVGVADGDTLWSVRYSSQGDSRTLFYNTDVSDLQRLYPGEARIADIPDDARVLASEPLGDLANAWNPVGEATGIVVQRGSIDFVGFEPRLP